MPFELVHNSYGKSAVRLTKVVRDGARHELFEIDAAVELEGDFAAAYAAGDNRQVIATDTIKNTVYVLAQRHGFDSVEAFAVLLANHFLATYPHVGRVTVELAQAAWRRIDVDGKPHGHAFVSDGSHLNTAKAVATRGSITLRGGISGLRVIKTTASAWENFHSDEYRTLKDVSDRILGTTIEAEWLFAGGGADFMSTRAAVVRAMLDMFASEFSPGAQFTLRQMGEAALAAALAIEEIAIALPNQHRLPFNFKPFGLAFENDVYVTTDAPYGLIKGTVRR